MCIYGCNAFHSTQRNCHNLMAKSKSSIADTKCTSASAKPKLCIIAVECIAVVNLYAAKLLRMLFMLKRTVCLHWARIAE